jgi:hypothetical protein
VHDAECSTRKKEDARGVRKENYKGNRKMPKSNNRCKMGIKKSQTEKKNETPSSSKEKKKHPDKKTKPQQIAPCFKTFLSPKSPSSHIVCRKIRTQKEKNPLS